MDDSIDAQLQYAYTVRNAAREPPPVTDEQLVREAQAHVRNILMHRGMYHEPAASVAQAHQHDSACQWLHINVPGRPRVEAWVCRTTMLVHLCRTFFDHRPGELVHLNGAYTCTITGHVFEGLSFYTTDDRRGDAADGEIELAITTEEAERLRASAAKYVNRHFAEEKQVKRSTNTWAVAGNVLRALLYGDERRAWDKTNHERCSTQAAAKARRRITAKNRQPLNPLHLIYSIAVDLSYQFPIALPDPLSEQVREQIDVLQRMCTALWINITRAVSGTSIRPECESTLAAYLYALSDPSDAARLGTLGMGSASLFLERHMPPKNVLRKFASSTFRASHSTVGSSGRRLFDQLVPLVRRMDPDLNIMREATLYTPPRLGRRTAHHADTDSPAPRKLRVVELE